MGLSLQVGMLANLADADSEGLAGFAEQFDAVTRALAAAGAPAHVEPRRLATELRWSADLFGYSGLHYLRRVAAHLDLRGTLPPPGGEDAADDRVLGEYYETTAQPGVLGRLFGKRPRPRTFDHLILHSDAEGFYAPVDFAGVIFSTDGVTIAGGMLGSAIRLRDECRRLAVALGVPADLDPDGDDLLEAAEAQGTGEGWRRYGVEAFTCVRLLHGAERALAARAALVFT